MIGGPKIPSGSSIPFLRSLNTETKTSGAGTEQNPQSIQEALSNNPALRAFRGESGFEGVSGVGGAQGVGGRGPADMLNRLGAAIQELVSTVETLLTQQAGGTDGTDAASAASGTDDASAANGSSGTDEASAADGTDAAQDASSADGSEDPIQQIFETLKQLLSMLEQFQQQRQGSGTDTSTAGADTSAASSPVSDV